MPLVPLILVTPAGRLRASLRTGVAASETEGRMARIPA
jgi:hypothetical protein